MCIRDRPNINRTTIQELEQRQEEFAQTMLQKKQKIAETLQGTKPAALFGVALHASIVSKAAAEALQAKRQQEAEQSKRREEALRAKPKALKGRTLTKRHAPVSAKAPACLPACDPPHSHDVNCPNRLSQPAEAEATPAAQAPASSAWPSLTPAAVAPAVLRSLLVHLEIQATEVEGLHGAVQCAVETRTELESDQVSVELAEAHEGTVHAQVQLQHPDTLVPALQKVLEWKEELGEHGSQEIGEGRLVLVRVDGEEKGTQGRSVISGEVLMREWLPHVHQYMGPVQWIEAVDSGQLGAMSVDQIHEAAGCTRVDAVRLLVEFSSEATQEQQLQDIQQTVHIVQRIQGVEPAATALLARSVAELGLTHRMLDLLLPDQRGMSELGISNPEIRSFIQGALEGDGVEELPRAKQAAVCQVQVIKEKARARSEAKMEERQRSEAEADARAKAWAAGAEAEAAGEAPRAEDTEAAAEPRVDDTEAAAEGTEAEAEPESVDTEPGAEDKEPEGGARQSEAAKPAEAALGAPSENPALDSTVAVPWDGEPPKDQASQLELLRTQIAEAEGSSS
eukprot:TRINITY_DN18312_c0_g1_i2.p1 TRINITY_DN18312_c0_g1~~TRINITY_DN18312_c0_g1_i2.p1  ORF type:complete len:567 (+),score=228.77 TRINITY_DN18312_c0_g1_i2:68-1768(+)